jgi:hypothetical protein
MRPIMIYLAKCGIRNMMYVDKGQVGASSKQKADADYAKTIEVFEKATKKSRISWEIPLKGRNISVFVLIRKR